MTWTLRLFDASGNEVGWATVDPLDYWVDPSHPYADFIDAMIDLSVEEWVETGEVTWTEEDGDVYPEMTEVIRPNETPARDRLDQSGTACVAEGWADRYELTDE